LWLPAVGQQPPHQISDDISAKLIGIDERLALQLTIDFLTKRSELANLLRVCIDVLGEENS
jgi:hypothetical protein